MDWEKTKPVLWGAVGGAILLAIIGFNWGGWVTTGTAEAMAKESAANAVAERLGSICVAQLNRDSEKAQKLKENEGTRYLGEGPLYRKAEVGGHAG